MDDPSFAIPVADPRRLADAGREVGDLPQRDPEGGPELDELVAELSSDFIALPSGGIDRAIEDALRRVCRCVGLSGSSLWQWSAGDPDLLSATHVYFDTPRPLPPMPIHARDYFPWCHGQLKAGKTLVLPTLEGLPQEAARDQETWRSVGTKATAIFPLSSGGGPLLGALSFNTTRGARPWPEALVRRLRLFSQILASALVRKAKDERLEASLALTRTIVESLTDGIVILDREGTILSTNDAWERFALENGGPGAAAGTGAGIKYLEVCRIAGALGAAEGVASVLDGRSDHYRSEYARHSPIMSRWYVMEVMPLRRADGGAVVLHRDVTARKTAEEELTRLRTDIWHAHRVAQTGAIAASLAHELNQPLTAILANAQAGMRMLTAKDPDLGEIRDALSDIADGAKRTAGVIVGLRAMLRRKETQRERIDVQATIQEVLTLAHSELLGRGIEVELRAEPGRYLSADRGQIQQVFLNLVTNAIEAMADLPPERRRLELTMTPDPAGRVVVSVRDRGTGIPADEAADVFGAFWTTKPQGMGIGLAICRSIIESHGGHLWFTNNEDAGVTFFASLPTIAEPAPAG